MRVWGCVQGWRRPVIYRWQVARAKLLDDSKVTEAREHLGELAARMGEHDSEILRLRTLADFLEGKA